MHVKKIKFFCVDTMDMGWDALHVFAWYILIALQQRFLLTMFSGL